MTLTATMSSMTVMVRRKIRSWVANLGAHHRERTQHESGVGADDDAPGARGLSTRSHRDVQQGRNDQTADRGQQGDRRTPWLPQLADGELTTDLQADDEEEQRHETVVHPVLQVHTE